MQWTVIQQPRNFSIKINSKDDRFSYILNRKSNNCLCLVQQGWRVRHKATQSFCVSNQLITDIGSSARRLIFAETRLKKDAPFPFSLLASPPTPPPPPPVCASFICKHVGARTLYMSAQTSCISLASRGFRILRVIYIYLLREMWEKKGVWNAWSAISAWAVHTWLNICAHTRHVCRELLSGLSPVWLCGCVVLLRNMRTWNEANRE